MNSRLRWSIIKHFACKDTRGFRLQDVVQAFPGLHRMHLSGTLSDMVEKGMLIRIDRNLFHILPLNADIKSYKPDEYQVAKYLTLDREYYIGYSTALRIHGLYCTPEGSVQVVTGTQMKPAVRRYGGSTYQFLRHSSNRFFGYESFWINHLEKARVSDLEKTIIDIAAKPELCGGISGLGEALFRAKDRTDHAKLCYYLARSMNKSARKRILFLTDILGLERTKEHDRMMKELGCGISLLDPSEVDKGRTFMKYGLKINVDPSHIQHKVLRYNNGIPGSYP